MKRLNVNVYIYWTIKSKLIKHIIGFCSELIVRSSYSRNHLVTASKLGLFAFIKFTNSLEFVNSTEIWQSNSIEF